MLGPWAMRLLAPLGPHIVWRVPRATNEVFLTFDDGPHPDITPWVLDTLARHGAGATFFCLGGHAALHPGLLQRMRDEGHTVGHHTWDHADGWRTPAKAYLESVHRAATLIGGPWFRAPYGRIPPALFSEITRRYRTVMWDIMPGDFLPGRQGLACAEQVLRQANPGSIVVLHDNPKSADCLREALDPLLEGLAARGLRPVPLDRFYEPVVPVTV